MKDPNGHSGQLGNINSIAIVSSSRDDLVHKDHLVLPLPDLNIVIPHPFKPLGQQGQLVKMGGKKRPGLFLLQKLCQGPGQRKPVISGCAPPDLIENDQAPGGQIVQDIRRLVHFDHKGTLAFGDLIVRADTGKYFINDPDTGRGGRDKRPHLGQDHQKSVLADIGGLAGHIGTGQNNKPVFLTIHTRIVRDKIRPDRSFHHRVPAFLYKEFGPLGNIRPDPLSPCRKKAQRTKRIDRGDLPRKGMNGLDLQKNTGNQLPHQFGLDLEDPVLRGQNLMFIFL